MLKNLAYKFDISDFPDIEEVEVPSKKKGRKRK